MIMQKFSDRYDEVVQNITKANAYNIDFKDDLDYLMYIIVANSERADDLIDTEQPRRMIEEAREVFPEPLRVGGRGVRAAEAEPAS